MADTSQTSPPANVRGSRAKRRPRHRPPFFAILLLSSFLLLALSFVTFRQIRAGEANRLRLLAGFAEQVEATVPELATRFMNVIDASGASSVEAQLETLPNVTLVDGPLDATAPEEQIKIDADGEHVYLVYHTRRRPREADETRSGDGNAAVERTEAASSTGSATAAPPSSELTRFVGRIDLEPAIGPIAIPDVFDLLVIADQKTEEVLFQQGEPELKMGRVSGAWEVSGDGLFARLTDWASDDDPPPPSGNGTRVAEVEIAGAEYRAFLQPVTLHFYDTQGNPVGTQSWIACGLISWERLLASSFSTSPVLLFLMVALLPILLATWPFLKLWLISSRQRFTRFDVAALLFSCVLAFALATFLLLDLTFMTRLQKTVDRDLEKLSDSLTTALKAEIRTVTRQLSIARNDPDWREAVRGVALASNAPGVSDESSAGPAPSSDRKIVYPFLHSIFWVDDTGEQIHKTAFHRDSMLLNRVADREYFRCAREQGHLELRQSVDVRSPAIRRAARRAAEQAPPSEGDEEVVCIQSIRSKTTAEDLTAFAIDSVGESSPSARRGNNERPPHRVVVLVTRLTSLDQALLAPSFAFAIVDAEGQVQFHSDRRRNATEDFSKAAGGDLLLTSLISERRTGSLSINYWGERYRAFVQPIRGTPWSIITLRDAGDLRARNFELLLDFLNPFLPYLAVLCGALFGLLQWGTIWMVRYLWPAQAHVPIYRAVLGAAPWIVLIFTLVWVTERPWWVFTASFWAPLSLMAVTLFYILLLRVQRTVDADGKMDWAPRWSHGPLKRAAEHLLREPRDDNGGDLSTDAPRLWRFRRETRVRDWVLPTTLLVTGWVLAQTWGFPRLLPFLLLTAAFIGWYSAQLLRRSFVDRTSTAPYVAAFTTFIVCCAILPTIGLFRLAESRQTQLLVQETQIGLANAEGTHRSRRIAERPHLAGQAVEDFDSYLARGVDFARAENARAFFNASVSSVGAPAPPESPTRWPFARSNEAGLRPGLPHLLDRFLAARLVPLTDLAPSPEGTDLSRYGFDAEIGGWGIAPGESGSPGRLRATLRAPAGTGDWVEVESAMPDDHLFVRNSGPRGILIVLSGLFLLLGAGWIAYFVASRVLLAQLAPNHRHAKLEEILAIVAPSNDPPKRLLLVYPLPESVVLMANHESRDGQFHVLHFASFWNKTNSWNRKRHPHLTPLWTKKHEVASPELVPTIIVSDFAPDLLDPHVAEEQITLLEELRCTGSQNGRSILIVTSKSYGELVGSVTAPTDESGEGASRARSHWGEYLARYSQRYGRDAGSREAFCKILGDAVQQSIDRRWTRPRLATWFDGIGSSNDDSAPEDTHSEDKICHTLSGPQSRRLRDLMKVIDHECRWTWRLQRIGLEILMEFHHELGATASTRYDALDSLPTKEQLVSRIDFAATSYYRRVWDVCDRDEKLILHQLAQEGVINPKGFDTALDLLNKGLIVREAGKPVLRLMNRSFRSFVLRTVQRSQLLAWEEEEGFSAWEVWKWILPLPILLLGVFLFITQQDAVSNIVGLLIALASLVPTGFNLYQQFQQMMTEREAGIRS